MVYIFIVENIKNNLKYRENIKNHPTYRKKKSPFCLTPFLCTQTLVYFKNLFWDPELLNDQALVMGKIGHLNLTPLLG